MDSNYQKITRSCIKSVQNRIQRYHEVGRQKNITKLQMMVVYIDRLGHVHQYGSSLLRRAAADAKLAETILRSSDWNDKQVSCIFAYFFFNGKFFN